MLDPVVIVLEGTSGVVGRIDEDALHFARVVLFKSLQRQKIVPLNEQVVIDVRIRDPLGGMIRALRLLQKNARLELRPVLLPYPCQLKFLFFGSHGVST